VSISAIHVTGAIPLPPIIAATKPAPPAETKPETPTVPSQRTHIGNSGAAPASTVVPPQVIEASGPLYAAIEGTVTLEASVDIQGNVHVLRVVKSLDAEIDARAIEAVANWKVAPASKDGVAVAA